ncbi:MAG: hypothetical protein DHS20C21_17290 [Gemmatimonadota bacterium]|nr:MAG: hypothetical protein DHS20C21_17290 [Gemmatimonadota bacterium]
MKRIVPILTALALIGIGAGCSQDELMDPGAEVDDSGPFAGDDDALMSPGWDPEHGVGATTRTYEITLENLTLDTGDGGSQVFSPPITAVHRSSLHVWQAGRKASPEVAGVAEDAANGPLLDQLHSSGRVLSAFAADGVIPPGASATWEVATAAGFRRLSLVFMLVNTNDAFSGVDGIHLPIAGERSWYLKAWDAGSEKNTELAEHIPGPCCGSPGAGPDTHDRIRRHPGIQGTGDLDPAKWGWDGPVAKLTVRRLAPAWDVQVENLTPATVEGGSQVFSPPLFATHHRALRLFQKGQHASPELEAIAEDGMNGPMLERLSDSRLTYTVGDTGAPLAPGSTQSFEVSGGFAFRRLSMVFMLVNTNDAFSGLEGARLPLGGRSTHYLRTYDAGTEENTELEAHIPGPCCGTPGAGNPTHERIRHHDGILGGGDLDPDVWGWEDPVATVTITRTR